MGMLQKIFIKKEFYKNISESPKRRFYGVNNVNLQDFSLDVINFINNTEDKINVCLNAFLSDLNIKIKIDKSKSNRSKLVFYNVDNRDEVYVLENGEIKALGNVVNNAIISYGMNNKNKVLKIFRYYETIISTFSRMSVPLTSRVEFRYGFFEDSYFYFKDETGMSGCMIYRVKKDTMEDKNDCYYFNLDEIQDMFEKTIIPDDYIRAFDTLRNFVIAKEQSVRDEISVELKRQESKDVLESKLEQKFIEILEIQKELSETYGELKRITLTSGHLFESVDGVRRIKSKWLPYLKYINLNKVNFEDVDISGVDFSYTNLKLDPQIVHNKDLRNCRFISHSSKEWIFTSEANFTGCLLDGTYIDDAPVRVGINNKTPNLKIVNRNGYRK